MGRSSIKFRTVPIACLIPADDPHLTQVQNSCHYLAAENVWATQDSHVEIASQLIIHWQECPRACVWSISGS